MFKTRYISMLVLLAAVATGAVAQTTYKVSVKEGTEDANSWTIAPPEATTTGVAQGTEVKATYGGTKKVKSVKAKKKAAVAAPTLTLGEMTQGGDPLNNGSGSETYSSPTFKEGDQIALVHGGVKDVVTVGKPNPDGSAPITGDITVGADNEENSRRRPVHSPISRTTSTSVRAQASSPSAEQALRSRQTYRWPAR